MQQIPIYFKSDFKLFIRTEAGFAVPFKFEFYTNMPSRPYIVKYDGHKYHNCELLEDGRLCIAFDDHGFGLGKLMIRQSYYLNDADYASEICDRVIAPQPVVNIDDNLLRSEIVLALSGDDTIEFTSQLPPYYQAGLTPEEHQALIDATVHAEEAAASANEQAGIATEAAKAADEARQALTTAYNEKVAALDADYAQKKAALEADYAGVKDALSSDYASVKAQLDADYAATKDALTTDYATALAGLNDRMTAIESQFSADREAWNKSVADFITVSQATFDGKLTEWQSQVDAAIADITSLQQKDVEQDQKLSELDEQINGNHLAQATQIYLGSYSSSGGYTSSTSQGYFFVDVKSFRGQSITCDSSLVIQYAFFKDFTPGQETTLADGTSRVTGKPVAVTIPQDADVLYLYIGQSITAPIPLVSVTGESEGIFVNIQEIENTATEAKELSQDNGKKIYELTPYVNKVKNLGWSYVFNGTSSVATLSSPIVLENDGDSIEFDNLTIEAYTQLNGYGFAKGGHSSMVGIVVYYNPNNGYCFVYVRADDGTFIFQKQTNIKLVKFKLSYEGGNILLAFNDTNVFTYQGQKKLTLLAFGKGDPSYGYWKGVIGTIFVNGESYDLFQNATHTDISIDNINGFLSTEQANLLNRQNPMYAEKTATSLKVYCKLLNGKYVGYPLTYRQKSYTEGKYPSFYDNWGILNVGIYDKTANGMQLISQIFQGGEAEMSINATSGISSAFVYVGGSAHGFENIMSDTNGRCISFLVDNQKISETESFSLRSISRIEVLQKSEICQAYTNSNPFAEALKDWIWDNEGFRIKTSVKITRSVAIHQAQLGMFCVYRRWNGDTSQSYLTNRAIKNNLPFEVFNVEDDWNIAKLKNADYGCTKITEYGEMGYGFSMEIKDANTRSNGGMFVNNNGTGKYNKIYYANCNDFSPNVGDELNATQVWSIEG